MRAVFVESSGFSEWAPHYLSEDDYARLQLELMENPQRGAVIPGCGGLRKLRVANVDRRKGKRGGVRIIYLYVPRSRKFLMLDVYCKGEQEDLTAAERRALSRLASDFRRELEARQSSHQGKRQ